MGHITCKTVPTTGIIGAIAGDCFGAAYEFHPVKHGDFDIYKDPRFTDDTVMNLAVAKWRRLILNILMRSSWSV